LPPGVQPNGDGPNPFDAPGGVDPSMPQEGTPPAGDNPFDAAPTPPGAGGAPSPAPPADSNPFDSAPAAAPSGDGLPGAAPKSELNPFDDAPPASPPPAAPEKNPFDE
jgi:hypothetical protein